MPSPPPVEQPELTDNLNLYEGLNKVVLVPGTAAPGKRGKGVGFYCEACNLTYKDSIQYLDHLNSKQHQYATGVKDNSAVVATADDVRKRLAYLKEKKIKEQQNRGSEFFDIQKRIEKRREVEKAEALRRQQKRAEKKRRQRMKRKRGDADGGESDESSNEASKKQAQDMATMMGFSNFGSSLR